jgi:membrane protease YdiL (CAAX protease family)
MASESMMEITPDRRLASNWHTVAVLVFLLFPFTLTPVASFIAQLVYENERPWMYLSGFAWQALSILLMSIGPVLKGKSLTVLLGVRWKIGRDSEIAIVSWLILIGIGVVLYLIFGAFDHSNRHVLPQTVAELTLFCPYAIFASISEELVFRGYLLKQLFAMADSTGIALVGQAAVFSLVHGYTQTFAGFLDKFSLGLLLGALVLWRRNLFPSMLAHVLLNVSAGMVSVFLNQMK